MEYAPFLFSALGGERDPAACFLTDVFRPCTHRHGYGGANTFPCGCIWDGGSSLWANSIQEEDHGRVWGKALASQRAAWFALDRLRLLGKVGKLGDAYRSVLYAGALHIGADCLFQVLFQPDALEIQVAPIWDCRCFWVKLEGIGTLRPWQIIGIAIGHQIRRSRRGKKIWHTPSKTL